MTTLKSMTTTSNPTGATALNPKLSGEGLALTCARSAIDKKGENLKILNVSKLSGFTDYFVIANGQSDRQVTAIADSIVENLAREGVHPLSMEGNGDGRWVLIDFGDVVVHVFLDALREYYDLERLWSEAPKVQIPAEFYGPAGSRLN